MSDLARNKRTTTSPVVSRRGAVRIGVAGMAAAIAPRPATAQDAATPAASALPPLLQAWVDAYNARDAAAMAALYASDAVYEDVPNAFIAAGAEIADFLAAAEQGLGDVRIEVLNGFETASGAVLEYVFHATNRGMIPVPGSEGKSFSSRAATVFDLDAGMIRRSSDYYDVMTILTQLGTLPPLAPGAVPAATPRP